MTSLSLCARETRFTEFPPKIETLLRDFSGPNASFPSRQIPAELIDVWSESKRNSNFAEDIVEEVNQQSFLQYSRFTPKISYT